MKAPRYAGGFMGKMDVGSAASVGKGLNELGKTIKLTDIAGALSVVVSTVEHSDVNGGTGGFAVLATETTAFRLRCSKRGERIAEATRLREGPIRALR